MILYKKCSTDHMLLGNSDCPECGEASIIDWGWVPVQPRGYMMACFETGNIEEMKHCTNLYMSGPKKKPGHEECKMIAVYDAEEETET